MTGSGIERAVACRFASVGPRIWCESGDDAEAGTEKHAHLQRVSNGVTPEESLANVPEAYREEAAAIDLDALRGELSLSAEVSLAYNVADDTARVLGTSTDRDYSTVTDDEIPMTLDVAGVGPDRVVTADYKTGFAKLTRAVDNWQIRGGALAMSLAFDRYQADSQLITIRRDRAPWRDRATFDAFDLTRFADELRATKARIDADRAAFARGEHVEPTEGPWCRYCPCAWSCPAKVGAMRLALGDTSNLPVTAADAGMLWERVDAGIKALKKLKSELISLASHEPLLLRIEDDGTAVYLGRTEKPGNEELIATIAIDEAAAVLGVEADAAFQREVAGLDVTKAAIERACKARGVKVAPTMKAILARVRARGGATKASKDTVGIYTEKRTS